MIVAIILWIGIQAQPSWHAAPAHDWNAKFERTDDWIGGDGAYSVALAKDRTLWLFSDTWIGKVRDGKRTDATIVNNTIAVQSGHGKDAKVDFHCSRDNAGKPRAWITPSDGRGWYWLHAGVRTGDRVALFLAQIEKTEDPGVFGFKHTGQLIGILANPDDAPDKWRITQTKLNNSEFSKTHEVSWGTAVHAEEKWIYVYGTEDVVKGGFRERYLLTARVAAETITDTATWEYFGNGQWHKDSKKAVRLISGMGSEGSVSFHAGSRSFLLVYTECGLSSKILMRTADKPWGPWSQPKTVYECLEPSWDKRIFCYGAKAHAALGESDGLLVCYFSNSFDFWHVAKDARLYWPRFIRLTLRQP